MSGKQRLGELLVEKGIVTQEAVSEALRIQVGGNRRLGYILIKMGLLSETQLLEILSQQLQLPIVDVFQEFSGAAKKILPRYICRKFSVIPLNCESNNVLNLAMMNPMDDAAIAEVENFTGLAVKPILARQQDIETAIAQLIPWSIKDYWNPAMYGVALKVISILALFLALGAGYMIQRSLHDQKYGIVSRQGETTMYKNQDLMVGQDVNGKISFMGRGAYSSGFYSVTFPDVARMRQFIDQKKKDFSERQYQWLLWLTKHELTSVRR